MLRDRLVRLRCAVDAANWALDGVIHASATRLHVKGIFLSAPTSDFYGYHGRVQLRLLDFKC
jgi:hypothetical protein